MIERHVPDENIGINDVDLLNRLQTNSKITASLAFKDRATAEKVVNKTFNDPTNAKKIENWMNSTSKDNLVLNYKGDGTPIGRGVKRGTTQIEDYSNAKIILQKDTSSSNFILTGYPTK